MSEFGWEKWKKLIQTFHKKNCENCEIATTGRFHLSQMEMISLHANE